MHLYSLCIASAWLRDWSQELERPSPQADASICNVAVEFFHGRAKARAPAGDDRIKFECRGHGTIR